MILPELAAVHKGTWSPAREPSPQKTAEEGSFHRVTPMRHLKKLRPKSILN